MRERREEARREQSFSDSAKDIVEIEEDKGYHREHGEGVNCLIRREIKSMKI